MGKMRLINSIKKYTKNLFTQVLSRLKYGKRKLKPIELEKLWFFWIQTQRRIQRDWTWVAQR